MYNALNQILPLSLYIYFFSIPPVFCFVLFFVVVFLHISFSTTCLKLFINTFLLSRFSSPGVFYLLFLNAVSLLFHVFSFSVSISFLISLVYWLL